MPMLFTVGFLLIFLLGGITGVMVSILPFDWAVTDSYFIVAHLHYVLNGAVVFPIFGAIYYWMPKMTGRMLNERLGKISFWVDVHRVQPDVLPDAHPRRARHAAPRVDVQQRARLGHAEPDRAASARSCSGWAPASRCSTGALSLRRGQPAPADPWGADSLEWSIASPPPEYNFAEIPVVSSRHPLWEGGAPPALPALDDTPGRRRSGRAVARARRSAGEDVDDHERARHAPVGRARDPRADGRPARASRSAWRCSSSGC